MQCIKLENLQRMYELNYTFANQTFCSFLMADIS